MLFAMAGMSGCRVGPDYAAPKADVADHWLDAKGTTPTERKEDVRWWNAFGDPTLDALIERAFKQNLTLRQAGLRVIQARALRGIEVGRFFPQSQVATGAASNRRVSGNSAQGSGDRSYSDSSVGVEAAWELDFWG